VTLATAAGFCVVVAGVCLLERHVVAGELARVARLIEQVRPRNEG